ncbi:MAG: hypothetical protein KUA37_03060 [Desulfomicrobium sp.]|nr:hypothetical protein [Pseudomonadota bacterium]MBV1710975.1 hypothetical protein [Desulfomicrobium sp.]MBU4570629.1 hypothetical protein [Pseudomonadota bacterium]MBU4593393.1 hypothetical protein [Pseudomonadota bacterium]MBV1719293.1 hypothetical protein [Desulfomicrobium sp.]
MVAFAAIYILASALLPCMVVNLSIDFVTLPVRIGLSVASGIGCAKSTELSASNGMN